MRLTLAIRDVLPGTPRTRIVRLDLAGNRFPYQPGQAVLIATPPWTSRKPYSIAAAPEDAERDGLLELLIGVDADGSAGPHLTLAPGAMVELEGPVGRFVFPDEPPGDRFLFVAGGTGIAPLRAMVRHALTQPYHRLGLFYSARAPNEFAYEAELRSLAREGRIDLRQTITREAPPEGWTGGQGRITRVDLEPMVDPRTTLSFVCGPPALVQNVLDLLGQMGVPADRIRKEEWG